MYTREGSLWYFNIEVNALIRRWQNHFLNGQNTNDDEIQEQLFAGEILRAQLMHKLGILTEWKRHRMDYTQYGRDRYRMWTDDHNTYDTAFLSTLISKHELKNEERGL